MAVDIEKPSPAEGVSGIIEVDAVRTAARARVWFARKSKKRSRPQLDQGDTDDDLLRYVLCTSSTGASKALVPVSAWGLAEESRNLRAREGLQFAEG